MLPVYPCLDHYIPVWVRNCNYGGGYTGCETKELHSMITASCNLHTNLFPNTEQGIFYTYTIEPRYAMSQSWSYKP